MGGFPAACLDKAEPAHTLIAPLAPHAQTNGWTGPHAAPTTDPLNPPLPSSRIA